MDTQFRLFPNQATANAAQVDTLFVFLISVSTFFVGLICCVILYFIIKYRRGSKADRTGQVFGDLRLEIAWSVIPLLLTMVMFAWGAQLYVDIHTSPADSIEIQVVAKQWMWKFQQPEGKREINTLHLALGRPVRCRMISEDVIHSLYIPDFRVKQDALPGRYSYLSFLPNKVGEYHLFCAEYCGTSHSKMIGRVIVQEPAEYANWLRGETHEPAEVVGRRLFEEFRCHTCHANVDNARCPPLVGLFGKQVPLVGGSTATVDEDYIRESILNPNAKVVLGYQPLMPTYKGQIGEEGIFQIIAYLKSLKEPSKSKPDSLEKPLE